MPEKPEMTIDESKTYRVTVDTNKGPVVMDLTPSMAPKTVNNFVTLARQGYYDGLTFHRYVADFVIQGADPTGTGSGGPGHQLARSPLHSPHRLGAAAMPHPRP